MGADRRKPDTWLSQGGLVTIESYNGKMPKRHADYLMNAKTILS